jgi:hypothetical protein
MAIGSSGRIVIDVDPEVKRRLYSALAISGITLKSWFLKEAVEYAKQRDPSDSIATKNQPDFDGCESKQTD